MRARLVAEESDSGYYYFEWLLEEVTVTGISNVRAVLPDGTMMTFEIIPERNPEVAVVMRSNPGQPKGIYKLLVTEHDPLLIEEGSVRVGGEDFPPVKQANVFGTFTTKGAANRAARELAEQWKREGYKTVTRSIEGRVTAGAAVGSSSTPILMCEVSRDDGGRTFEDGRVEY